MVLGFLIYETIDVAYHVTKMTLNSASMVYNWYYDINIYSIDNKVKTDEEHIKVLEDRVKQLEDMILVGDLKTKNNNCSLNNNNSLLLGDSI